LGDFLFVGPYSFSARLSQAARLPFFNFVQAFSAVANFSARVCAGTGE
jgi:hypothetical protein